MWRRPLTALAIAMAGAAVAACGDSADEDAAPQAEEDAMAQVCSARNGIGEEVEQLSSMTVTTATTEEISSSVQSIRDDLTTLAQARGELSEERRAEVDEANEAFAAEVRQIAGTLLKSTSLEEGRAELEEALASLEESYRDSLGTIDCP
jgi:chromosome segregation ATPase